MEDKGKISLWDIFSTKPAYLIIKDTQSFVISVLGFLVGIESFSKFMLEKVLNISCPNHCIYVTFVVITGYILLLFIKIDGIYYNNSNSYNIQEQKHEYIFFGIFRLFKPIIVILSIIKEFCFSLMDAIKSIKLKFILKINKNKEDSLIVLLKDFLKAESTENILIDIFDFPYFWPKNNKEYGKKVIRFYYKNKINDKIFSFDIRTINKDKQIQSFEVRHAKFENIDSIYGEPTEHSLDEILEYPETGRIELKKLKSYLK